jgi:ribonuclease-3
MQGLGYSFRDSSLLEEALTHPSLGKKRNNQRLEFLGDAVLGMLVSRLLFDLYPTETEGELARRHAALVCGPTLAQAAREAGLGEHLHLAASKENAGGRDNPTNLEDACEALIGALYIDGGIAAAEAFVMPRWEKLARSIKAPPKDAKTSLQEWAQARGLPVPSYIVLESEGPAHAPVFTVEARVQGHPPACASAPNKRAAEQTAAAELLGNLTSQKA